MPQVVPQPVEYERPTHPVVFHPVVLLQTVYHNPNPTVNYQRPPQPVYNIHPNVPYAQYDPSLQQPAALSSYPPPASPLDPNANVLMPFQ